MSLLSTKCNGCKKIFGYNTAKLIVMALRQDTNPAPTDKEVKRMFGGK